MPCRKCKQTHCVCTTDAYDVDNIPVPDFDQAERYQNYYQQVDENTGCCRGCLEAMAQQAWCARSCDTTLRALRANHDATTTNAIT